MQRSAVLPPLRLPAPYSEGMITNLLLAAGVICLILALLAFAAVIKAPATLLLVTGIVCLVAGYFMRGSRDPRF